MTSFIRQRLRHGDERGVALITAVFLMVVILGLCLVMAGVVLVQLKPTLLTAKSTRTIAAAQAGIDAAASQIRSAIHLDPSGEDMGDIHKLPCQVAGKVDDSDEPTMFAVKIFYYSADPSVHTEEWQDDPANQLPCKAGTGPERGLKKVPGYALMRSSATDPSATASVGRFDRTIEATYKFYQTSVNTAGGQIFNHGKSHCIVAASMTAGAPIRYQDAGSPACKEANELNLWLWDHDYMIHLANSLSSGTDLCISGRRGSATYRATTLQPCTTTAADPLGQRFSWRDGGTWRSQNAANTNYEDSTLQADIDNGSLDGRALAVGQTKLDGNAYKAFEPQPNVGGGNASHATNQVVSQLEFGRCLDVFRDKLYMPYSILYPCKQDPSGNGQFRWNHKWRYSEPAAGTTQVQTKIIVIPEREGGTFDWYGANLGRDFCFLTTQTKGFVSATPDQLPYTNPKGVDMREFYYPRFGTGPTYSNSQNSLPAGFAPQCGSADAVWTRYGDTGDTNSSWTFQDRYGRCMSAAGPEHHGDQDVGSRHSRYGEKWTTVVIEDCDGSIAQKWNGSNPQPARTIRDFIEVH